MNYKIMAYYKRNIDAKLLEWKDSVRSKPLLIHDAVRHVDIVPLYALSNL